MLSKPISALAKRVSSGLTPLRSNPEFWLAGTIPWLKTEQLGEKFIYSTTEKISEAALRKTSIKVYPPNTLSIAMYGEGKTRGNVSIIKSEMATNQACCNIELDPDLADFEYVYYFLKTQYNELRNLSSGVRKNLNSDAIKNFVIRLPRELRDQNKIAAVLSALDAKIDCNNRINAELEAMAKVLYDYWFVQFDFPDAHGKPYKTAGGEMVYNATLKRDIPKGWEVEPLIKSCEVIDCLHSKKPDFTFENAGEYLLQLENILDNGQIDLSNKYFVSRDDYKLWTSRIEVKEHDVVMTNAGRVAAFAQIPSGVVCGIGRNITAIRPKEIQPNFFYLSLSGKDVQKQILTNLDQGAFFKSFNVKGIKILNSVRPGFGIEDRFERVITPFIKKRHEVMAENQQLAQLRDWLLPMLMNGQVTVE